MSTQQNYQHESAVSNEEYKLTLAVRELAKLGVDRQKLRAMVDETLDDIEDQRERYFATYRDGYYVVIDTTTGNVVPSEPEHYKRHKDGYLWVDAAVGEADRLNKEAAQA